MRERHIRRAARNVAVALLLAALLWAVKGYPLPTMELELHRAERQRAAYGGREPGHLAL